MTTYIDQTELTSRLGSAGVAKIASPIWTLDATATTLIAEACTDANGLVDTAVAGLGLTLSPVPAALVDIATRIVIPKIFKRAWDPVGVPVPQNYLDAAKEATDELDAMKKGTSRPDGSTPAVQVVGKFSHFNVGDNPRDTNPRQTVRAKMKGLP